MSQTIEYVQVNTNYGPAKVGVNYQVITYGRDCVTINCRGRYLHVPKELVTGPVDDYVDTDEEYGGQNW